MSISAAPTRCCSTRTRTRDSRFAQRGVPEPRNTALTPSWLRVPGRSSRSRIQVLMVRAAGFPASAYRSCKAAAKSRRGPGGNCCSSGMRMPTKGSPSAFVRLCQANSVPVHTPRCLFSARSGRREPTTGIARALLHQPHGGYRPPIRAEGRGGQRHDRSTRPHDPNRAPHSDRCRCARRPLGGEPGIRRLADQLPGGEGLTDCEWSAEGGRSYCS